MPIPNRFACRPLARSTQFLAIMLLAACTPLDLEDQPPVARAEIKALSKTVKSGATVAYDGSPVAVTLDGSKSVDPDGDVVEYIWLRTDVPASARYPQDGGGADEGDDAGAGEPPMPASPPFAGDPPNQKSPELRLGPGRYRFSLWVRDDDGKTSAPDSVIVQIGPPAGS